MKDLLLFLTSICVGLVLIVSYSTFIRQPKINPVTTLQTLFKATNFSLEKAPSETLVGRIGSMSGEVEWQGRTATESARINSLINIQQGEDLLTKDDGKASVLFNGNLEVDISPKTRVGFAQTLPADIVLFQSSGSAEYKKLGSVPVSIRVMHLLIENGGDISISVDDVRPIVTAQVINGTITFSYNDSDNVTSVTTIGTGRRLIFNDDTRIVVTR